MYFIFEEMEDDICEVVEFIGFDCWYEYVEFGEIKVYDKWMFFCDGDFLVMFDCIFGDF